MFIEVTDIQYNKKQLLNITNIIRVTDNNKDNWFPCTEIEYKDSTISVKESYSHIKTTIDKMIDKLSNKGKN